MTQIATVEKDLGGGYAEVSVPPQVRLRPRLRGVCRLRHDRRGHQGQSQKRYRRTARR